MCLARRSVSDRRKPWIFRLIEAAAALGPCGNGSQPAPRSAPTRAVNGAIPAKSSSFPGATPIDASLTTSNMPKSFPLTRT